MKRSLLALTIALLAGFSAFAQERPRYYDNFDTSRGVQVSQYPPELAVSQHADRRSARRANAKHYLPSPSVGPEYDASAAEWAANDRKLIKKTVEVEMSTDDDTGYRRSPQYTANPRTAMAAGSGMRGYSTGDSLIDSYIVDSSRRYGIDPLLIYSQMSTESAFKLNAKSYKGASGLMQLMPATARRLGVVHIYDPKENIEGGVKYMRILLDMFNGDVNLALAGYNAGEGAVIKYGYQIPPFNETQAYVRLISARYRSVSNKTVARNYDR